MYTFSNWEHRVGGTVIRHLPGVIIDNISYLQLSHCTYQDKGTYFCTVGNNISHPNNTMTSVAIVDIRIKGLIFTQTIRTFKYNPLLILYVVGFF